MGTDFCKIMATTLENKYFDLEFFMKSSDVGLYNVAKKIFSYMDHPDLTNLSLIGKSNKTFDYFLKKEKDFLRKKFEKVTFKILKRETLQFIGLGGETRRRLENTFRVSIWINSERSGRFNFVTIRGNKERVITTIQCVFCVMNPDQFKQDNPQFFQSFDEETKKKFNEGRVINLIDPTQVVVKILSKNIPNSYTSVAEIQKTLKDSFKVRLMIWPLKPTRDGTCFDGIDPGPGFMDVFTYVTITGDLHGVKKAVRKVEDMVHGCCGECAILFYDYNPGMYQCLMEKIRSLDELKATNQMSQLKLH